jgi:cytochrome P450
MCNSAVTALSAPRLPRDEPVVYGSLRTQGETERLKSQSPLHTGFLANPSLGYASEVLDHLYAGFETSGITLTYLTHEMSLNPALQAKLRAELLTLKTPIVYPPPPKSGDEDHPLPNYKELDALPLLHAILLETLRLHAAIPGIQPRITPAIAGGTTLGTGAHVYSGIPGGVRVQASAWALHRNSVAFPEPEKFLYERWLVPASETKSESEITKERAYWAFGSGGRMCVGSNFAIHGKF